MYLLSEVVEFSKSLSVYSVLTDEQIRDKFIELYFYAFEMHPDCTGCAGDIEQAIYKFMWLIKKHSDEMELQKAYLLTKYKMKPKVRLYSSSLNMMVTEYNCTDSIAEHLIKENAKYAELFTLNPEYQNIEVLSKNITSSYSVTNEVEDKVIIEPVVISEEKKPEAIKVQQEYKKRGRKKKNGK